MLDYGYTEENIENAAINNIIKSEIKDKKYNFCTSTSYDIEYISKYYFYKYQKYIKYNIESAYNKLDKEYKKQKFPTLQDYRNYLAKNIKNIVGSNLAAYNIKKGDNYKDYICVDEKGNKYTFRETGINEYTIILNH